jgi:hypothetical protein
MLADLEGKPFDPLDSTIDVESDEFKDAVKTVMQTGELSAMYSS